MSNKEIESILNINGILTADQQQYVLVGDEFLNTTNIKRNTFPDAVLEFTSANKHILTAQSSVGLGQCVAVLCYELDFEDTDDLDIYERRRYSKAIIGTEVFETFTANLINAFLKYKEATLISLDDKHARGLVKIFYKVDDLGNVIQDNDDYTKYNY